MILRTSIISNTKKFLQEALNNFKSFLHGKCYRKLPKTPPCNPIFRHCFRGDGVEIKLEEPDNQNNPMPAIHEDKNGENITEHAGENSVINDELERNKKSGKRRLYVCSGKEPEHDSGCSSDYEKQSLTHHLVAEKLKELAMVDENDVEHVHDIEEVFYYYSRLTCPAYRDIIDKFIMDLALSSPVKEAAEGGRRRSKEGSIFSSHILFV